MIERPDRTLSTLTGYRLRRATSRMLSSVAEALAPFGLRRTTFSALTVVVDNPGLSQSQLADALAMERPNIVQIVGELEKLGLVHREPAENDRRAYALRPTEAGRAMQKDALDAIRASDAALTDGMSESDIRTLHCLLRQIEESGGNGERGDVRELSRP